LTSLISGHYLKIKDPITDLPSEIESIWIDLYERGFIEIEDVHLAHKWIEALKSIGYKFPKTKTVTMPDVKLQKSLILSGKSLSELNSDFVRNLNGEGEVLNSKCPDSYPSLIFANSDLHSGPRSDLPTILPHLKQKVILMGPKGADTNYPEVFQEKSVNFFNEMSITLQHYDDHSHKLTDRAMGVNTEFYKVTKYPSEKYRY